MPGEKLVDAVAKRAFSSPVHGNLSQGDPLKITQARFNVWKEQGLVDHPDAVVGADVVNEMPETDPVHRIAGQVYDSSKSIETRAVESVATKPAPKKRGNRKGKARK